MYQSTLDYLAAAKQGNEQSQSQLRRKEKQGIRYRDPAIGISTKQLVKVLLRYYFSLEPSERARIIADHWRHPQA